MLLCLLRGFSRNLSLTHPTTVRRLLALPTQPIKTFVTTKPSYLQNNEVPSNPEANSQQNILDVDDYLVSFTPRDEKTLMNKELIMKELTAKMRISENDCKNIIASGVNLKRVKFMEFDRTMEILLTNVINKNSVIENPFILCFRPKMLEAKLALLHLLKPKNINDFVPFLKLSTPRLQKLVRHLVNESDVVPNGNRIYFISAQLKISPNIVSTYLSRRLFMLEMPLDTFCENLNNMINYGVEPLNILRDLWAFRYTPKSVRARLERVKKAKKDKVMPWMVRCPETILERSLNLTLEEKKLLGDENSVVDYISNRLQFDKETTNSIMQKHPAVFRVRVTKIKEVLDYLLNEAGFTRYDVGQVPRILCHSLQTTKQRMDELKSYGCIPSSLVIVCRSRREYQKFLSSWVETKNKMRKQKV